MKRENQTPLQQLDYTLLFIIFLMLCVSLISIYSAPDGGTALVIRQFAWFIAGGVVIVVMMLIDFDRFRHIAWYLYGFGILLLIPLALAALPPHIVPSCKEGCLVISEYGAISWYRLPIIGSFQPSEFMKIFLIIALSHVIVKHQGRNAEKTLHDDLVLLGKMLIVALIPIALVMVEPDLGTSLILVAITASLMLISGIRWRLLLLIAVGGLLALALVILLYVSFPSFPLFSELFNHVEPRIFGWLYPDEYPGNYGFQLNLSKEAIGSGQLYGQGFGSGAIHLPVAYSDFIFPVIAKHFGFLGASVVISLFFLLIYRIIHTALETHDPFGSYLCTGVIGMITFQVFQNIGMTIQVLPITGIPLPFISYGGTALLTCMIAAGLVLNVRSRQRTYMFD